MTVANATVEGVGDSVLLTIEGYQFLMDRDTARQIGMGMVKVVATGGDVLDDVLDSEPQAKGENGGTS